MKAKYYKQIINSLDVKLEDAIQANERLIHRIKVLESSNEQLRHDLGEMSTELLRRQIIDEKYKQLEEKLKDQIEQNHTVYKRMAKAEEEVIWLRSELNELSKDFINKHNEDINS